MFKCCYPGFATFLRFKHHNSFSNQRLHFRKTLGSNGSTKGTNAGEVLIQVSSRLRTRRISEENEFTSRTKRQAIYSLLGKFSLWRLRGEVGGDE